MLNFLLLFVSIGFSKKDLKKFIRIITNELFYFLLDIDDQKDVMFKVKFKIKYISFEI